MLMVHAECDPQAPQHHVLLPPIVQAVATNVEPVSEQLWLPDNVNFCGELFV